MSISGRKRSDGIDYYQTPAWATEELLKKEKFEGTILEPCAGAGAISKVLEEKGFQVISSDIRDDENVYGMKNLDMFTLKGFQANNVITNPPYFCAIDSIKKSLEITDRKVAMIFKLQFLESQKRYELFKTTPLKNVYVFCKRVVMWNELLQPDDGTRSQHGGTIAFAWYVWEHGYIGKPQIDWIL